MKIRVPGSTSNLGAGFDSIGLAINRYLEIEAKEQEEWEFFSKDQELSQLPRGKDNLIYEAFHFTEKWIGCPEWKKGYRVSVKSEVPLSRGLGSSSTAIVAGIELANQAHQLGLSPEEKVKIGTDYEGHPDNVAPAILGGGVIALWVEGKLFYDRFLCPGVSLVVFVPAYHVPTKEAREILPKELLHSDAIRGSAVANLLVAGIKNADWKMVGEMSEMDIFHEPYRKSILPDFLAIKSFMKKEGAFGTFLSGAGPTMISFVSPQVVKENITRWKASFPDILIEEMNVSQTGVEVCKEGD
ncbi:homoserine kinase [Bacillaceae bacterium S4-13-56]